MRAEGRNGVPGRSLTAPAPDQARRRRRAANLPADGRRAADTVAVRGGLPPGVAVFWLALKRSRSVLSSSPEVPRCCRSLPAVLGLSGLQCLFIRATTPSAGSVLWARTNLCFHNSGIKRSLGLLLEHQPVNPGGGQFFPCLLVLPSRHAAALSCLSVR